MGTARSFVFIFCLVMLATFVYAFTAGNDDTNFVSGTLGDASYETAGDGDYNFDFYINQTPTGEWGDGDINFKVGFYYVNRLPVVTITSPSNGDTISSATVTIIYSGTDADGSITKYWVSSDGTNYIDNGTNTSYNFTSQTNGAHTYYVKGTDEWDENGSAASVSITVSVSSGGATGVYGYSTCAQQGGDICAQDEVCSGRFLGASDSTRCCNVVCTPTRILELGEECQEDSQCASGRCVNGLCSECAHDIECADDEYCAEGICAEVQGECGYAKVHAWINYECCSNADCAENEYCDIEIHSCLEIEEELEKLNIEISPAEPIAGETVTVYIKDEENEPVTDVTLTINDELFDVSDGVYSFVPEQGEYILKAEKEGYTDAGLSFHARKEVDIIVSAETVTKGELVKIEILDDQENPLASVEVLIVLPDGTIKILKTNAEGIAYMQAHVAGDYQIKVRSTGFAALAKTITVKGEVVPLRFDFGLIGLAVVAILVVLVAVFLILKKTMLLRR